jgi:uncharacterized coiled-coil protein SlyX
MRLSKEEVKDLNDRMDEYRRVIREKQDKIDDLLERLDNLARAYQELVNSNSEKN